MTELSSSVPGAEPGKVVGAGELPGRGRPQPPRKSSAAQTSREELVALLTQAHNQLGDCICTVGIDNSTEKLLERIRAVLDKEDSVYAADE